MARLDRALPTFAVILSLALTTLTVTAIFLQGRTLEARERQQLRDEAARFAAVREQRLTSDIERWLRDVRAIADLGAGGVERWLLTHPYFRLAALRLDEVTTLLPRQPLLTGGEWGPLRVLPEAPSNPIEAESFYEQHADSADPRERYAALVGLAAGQAQRGSPNLAARHYGLAADALAERGIQATFGPRLAAMDVLISADDYGEAGGVLQQLLSELEAAPPGLVSAAEIELVRRRLETLPADVRPVEAEQRLDRAARAAGLRSALPALGRMTREATNELRLRSVDVGGSRLAIAMRSIDGLGSLVLAAPLSKLVRGYWRGDAAPGGWIVAPVDAPGAGPVRHALSAAFDGYELRPSELAQARLRQKARQRLIMLIAVTLGAAAAWSVVIWMLMRALAHQRELMNMQRRFVADVSHELKTPLALIRLHAETLAEGRVRSAERAQQYHRTITRESERLTMLLDNILDFSRIELGRKAYAFAPCDLSAVCEQAWALFLPRFKEDGFSAELSISDDLPIVVADEQAISQVVVNLLQNAYRYADRNRFVRLAAGGVGDKVVITVEDRGIGMSRSQTRRIGASFERGQDARVRRTRGAGLGLAIVKHIVAAHQGALDVNSIPNEGSTFVVRLPVAGPQLAERGARRRESS